MKPELALFNGNGHTSRSVSEPISTSFVYLLDIYFKKKNWGLFYVFVVLLNPGIKIRVLIFFFGTMSRSFMMFSPLVVDGMEIGLRGKRGILMADMISIYIFLFKKKKNLDNFDSNFKFICRLFQGSEPLFWPKLILRTLI